MNIHDLIDLADKNGNTFSFTKRHKRKPYKFIERPKFTRQQLIDFLKNNNIKSSRKIDKIRKNNDPCLSDYRLEFTFWKDAIKEAFPEDTFITSDDQSALYFINLLRQFQISTLDEYKAKRKICPDLIPSIYQLNKYFGGFSNIKSLEQRYNISKTIESYIKLKQNINKKTLSVKKCKDSKVDISFAVKFFGSKEKFDKFVRKLERK